MQNEVLVRTVSALILGVLVLALTWTGGVPFRLLAVTIMLLLFYEWFRIVEKKHLSATDRIVGGVTMLATAVAIMITMPLLALACCLAGAIILTVLRRIEGHDLYAPLGLLYAGFFGIAFTALRGSEPTGWMAIIIVFAVIWATDVFAFFGGRSIGGPKLAPQISPKKTWSGFLSGLAGGVVCGIIAGWILGAPEIVLLAFLCGALSIVGQIGDLFESGLKRHFDVKDSSDLIPGHGGVMDRVDSLVFAVIAAYLLSITWTGLDLTRIG